MASKGRSGNSPLGGKRIDASKGVNPALDALSDQVGRRTPRQSMTAGSKQVHNGVFLESKKSRRAATEACNLGTMINGVIANGHVMGGGLTVFLEPTALTATAGYSVYIKCTWTADLVDGVLQAGGTMGAVTIETPAASVPVDDVPSAADVNGIAYYALGSWDSESKWIKSGCGTITIDFCPGGFTKVRG